MDGSIVTFAEKIFFFTRRVGCENILHQKSFDSDGPPPPPPPAPPPPPHHPPPPTPAPHHKIHFEWGSQHWFLHILVKQNRGYASFLKQFSDLKWVALCIDIFKIFVATPPSFLQSIGQLVSTGGNGGGDHEIKPPSNRGDRRFPYRFDRGDHGISRVNFA